MNIAQRGEPQSTSTSHIEIRLATVEDVPELARLFGVFFNQSQWHFFLTYDEQRAAGWLHWALSREDDQQPHLVAFDGDKLIACLSWHYYSQYTVEPVAVMDETFVLEEYRHTDLGRKLVALALYMTRGKAGVFNFPLASGLPETKTYVNMLKKYFGGEMCGVIVRCIPQGGDDGR